MGKIQEIFDKSWDIRERIGDVLWPFFYIWFVLSLIPSFTESFLNFGRKDESITSISAKESSWIIPYFILGLILPFFVVRIQKALSRKPVSYFKYIKYYPAVYLIQTSIYLYYNPFQYSLLLPIGFMIPVFGAYKYYIYRKELLKKKRNCRACGVYSNFILNSDEKDNNDEDKYFCLEHLLQAFKQSISDKKARFILLSPQESFRSASGNLDFLTFDDMEDYGLGENAIKESRALMDYILANKAFKENIVAVRILAEYINYNDEIDKLILKKPEFIETIYYTVDQFIDYLKSELKIIKDSQIEFNIAKPYSKNGFYVWVEL